MKCFAVCFAAMLVALGFTACNEAAPDAPEDKVLLSLSTSLNNDNWEDESRVNRDDNDKRSILSFAEGDTIRVDAWYMPQGGSSATDEPDVFRKQLMTYTNSLWDYSPKKYWTNIIGDKMAFFAYYLDGANCIVDDWNSTTYYPTMKFGHKMRTDDPDEPLGWNYHKDILAAPVKMLSKEELVEGKVPLQFNHIMARLKLKVRYGDGGEKPQDWTKVVIEKITLWNFPDKGTFTGFSNDGKPLWSNISYCGLGVSASDINENNELILEWGKGEDAEGFTYIPSFTQYHYPFDTHVSDVKKGLNPKIGFVLFMEKDNGERSNQIVFADEKLELYLEDFGVQRIEAGLSYTINVTIKGNISLTVSVEKSGGATDWWTSGSNPDYNISESY